jgi:hypothetical protein
VIAAAHVEMIWIKQLKAKKRENALHAEGTAIDKITVEKIRV